MVGAVPGDDGFISAFAGNGGIDSGGEVHCALSGVQTRAVRGVFSDWNSFEYFGGDGRGSDPA